MTRGETFSFARAARMRSHCSGSILGARHMRGLAEKICRVLAPIAEARSTAFQAPPAVPMWAPIRCLMRTVYLSAPASSSRSALLAQYEHREEHHPRQAHGVPEPGG